MRPIASRASSVHFEMFSPHRKRRKTSTAGFFADSDESSDEAGAGTPAAGQDELAAYLALPQVSMKEVSDPLQWWREHAELYPNVAVMARGSTWAALRRRPQSSGCSPKSGSRGPRSARGGRQAP